MDKKFAIGLLTGAVIVGLFIGINYPYQSEAGIPPTPAFKTFIINSSAVYSTTGDENVTALVYNDELYLLSDGSIGMNITSYTP